MALHAHAVAEDRAAAERAGRIDGEHADLEVVVAQHATSSSVSVDFPAPGAPVIPTDHARPVCGCSRLDDRAGAVAALLDEREQLGRRRPGHRASARSTSASVSAGMP